MFFLFFLEILINLKYSIIVSFSLDQKHLAWVAELVDARDLKSLGASPCTSSILVPGTNKIRGLGDSPKPFSFCF